MVAANERRERGGVAEFDPRRLGARGSETRASRDRSTAAGATRRMVAGFAVSLLALRNNLCGNSALANVAFRLSAAQQTC
jgi:hypothetical protein